MRPLTGRELNGQHKALVEAGMTAKFCLDWLRSEVAIWTEAKEKPDDGQH